MFILRISLVSFKVLEFNPQCGRTCGYLVEGLQPQPKRSSEIPEAALVVLPHSIREVLRVIYPPEENEPATTGCKV